MKGQDYFPLLEGKAGRKVLLAIYNPATGKRFDITIKAISMGEQSNLLYKRWVEDVYKRQAAYNTGLMNLTDYPLIHISVFYRYHLFLGKAIQRCYSQKSSDRRCV